MQEIIFSGLVCVSYFGTGISCAVYAAAWGGPPKLCDASRFPEIDTPTDDFCDAIPLTATNALQAVSTVQPLRLLPHPHFFYNKKHRLTARSNKTVSLHGGARVFIQVLCFIQIGVFGVIIFLCVVGVIKSRSGGETTTTT